MSKIGYRKTLNTHKHVNKGLNAIDLTTLKYFVTFRIYNNSPHNTLMGLDTFHSIFDFVGLQRVFKNNLTEHVNNSDNSPFSPRIKR